MVDSLPPPPPADDDGTVGVVVGSASDLDDDMINLTSSETGAVVLFATDEWFAIADNLLNPHPPTFDPDAYCPEGKVMDGWETRRRRSSGHDWCVIALGRDGGEGAPGAVISRIEIDTAYFTGNQAPRISVEATRVARRDPSSSSYPEEDDDGDDEDYLYAWMPGASTRLARGGGKRGTWASPSHIKRATLACKNVVGGGGGVGDDWMTILPIVPLMPGYDGTRHHSFAISTEATSHMIDVGGVTHLRLNYFPDGGVARIRAYGRSVGRRTSTKATTAPGGGGVGRIIVNHDDASPPLSSRDAPSPLPSMRHHPRPELSSELNGGIGLACSNAHYGMPSELLRPELGTSMNDGWETARHPDRPPVVTRDANTGLQDTTLSDWSVIKLGLGGAVGGGGGDGGVDRIIVDTRHFKGNYPESVAIDGCYVDPEVVSSADERVCESASGKDGGSSSRGGGIEWFPLLRRTRLTAHAEHEYAGEYVVNSHMAVTHVRVSITPDGGLSRVRIYGHPAKDGTDPLVGGSKL